MLAGRYRGDAHPHSVLGSALAIAIDFGVPVFFCSNRQIACRFVEGYLLRAAERRDHWQNPVEPAKRRSVALFKRFFTPALTSPRAD